jgi:F1F0 ATPase subunit 2
MGIKRITMSDLTTVFISVFLGTGLGLLFFGGLYWTVQRGIKARRGPLFFFSSFLIRIFFAALGFYVIGREAWLSILAALFGFMLVKAGFLYLQRREREYESQS